MNKPISFKVSPEDATLIAAIERRVGERVARDARQDLVMDLTALQANAEPPYDLARLLSFPDHDFWHDVGGIRQNLNRETGALDNFFAPRCGRRAPHPHTQALRDIYNMPVHGLTGVEVMHSLQAIAKAALAGEPYDAKNPLGIFEEATSTSE